MELTAAAGPTFPMVGAELPLDGASVFQFAIDSTALYCLTAKRLFSLTSMLSPKSFPFCSLLPSLV